MRIYGLALHCSPDKSASGLSKLNKSRSRLHVSIYAAYSNGISNLALLPKLAFTATFYNGNATINHWDNIDARFLNLFLHLLILELTYSIEFQSCDALLHRYESKTHSVHKKLPVGQKAIRRSDS